MFPLKQKLTILKGRTFEKGVRWESSPHVYVPIQAIAKQAPALVTTTVAHGLTAGWRAAVVSVLGMTAINAASSPPADSDYRPVTIKTPTQVEFNDINAAEFETYISGGYLQFYTPVDLTGFTARMSIKDRDGVLLLSLTTENGGITVDNAAKLITLQITAAASAALTWTSGNYDLELVSTDGKVSCLMKGSVTVTPEITT